MVEIDTAGNYEEEEVEYDREFDENDEDAWGTVNRTHEGG
jgi:hypothetical protein